MARNRFSLFFFTLCFVVANSIENEKTVQIGVLERLKSEMRCWTHGDVVSRKVTFKDRKTSINDFLATSAAESLDKWPIDRHNVNDLHFLMSTVLNCEYCESMYKIFEYVRIHLVGCERLNANIKSKREQKSKANNVENVRNLVVEYRSCAKKIVQAIEGENLLGDQIARMLLTIEGFVNNTKNVGSSKQDVFKILLSLYLHARNVHSAEFDVDLKPKDVGQIFEIYDIIANHMTTLDIIDGQVTMALREYGIANCRSVSGFTEFARKLSDGIDEANAISRIESEIRNMDDTIAVDYVQSGHVVTSAGRHERLLNVLGTNINADILWNSGNYKMQEIHTNYIKNCTDVSAILKYDHIMFEIMTNLVYGKIVQTLRPMLTGAKNTTDLDVEQVDAVLTTFSDFLSNLNPSKHPIVFVRHMAEVNHRLSTAVSYLKVPGSTRRAEDYLRDMGKCVTGDLRVGKPWISTEPARAEDEPKSTESGVPEVTVEITTLEMFLNEFVLREIDNAYLNPAVTNVLYRTSYLIVSGPFEFVFDFKILHRTWFYKRANKQNTKDASPNALCTSDVPNLLHASRAAMDTIQACRDKVESLASASTTQQVWRRLEDDVKSCFESFYANVVELKNRAIAVFEKAYAHDVIAYQARKMMLTLIVNLTSGRLYDAQTQNAVDGGRVESLMAFHSNFDDKIKTFRLLRCESPARPMSGEPRLRIFPIFFGMTNDFLALVRDKFASDSSIQRNCSVVERANLCMYQACMVYYFARFISAFLAFSADSKTRFHWNGRRINMADVRSEFTDGTFELQDAVERQYLTVKWLYGWIFSALVNALNGMLHFNIDRAAYNVTCFINGLKSLSYDGLMHVTYRPIINSIIDSFTNIVENGGQELELKSLKRLIVEELKIFGVVTTTLPRVTGKKLSEYIDNVCSGMNALVSGQLTIFHLIEHLGYKQLLTGTIDSSTRNILIKKIYFK